MKRLFDIVCSVGGLVLLSPVLVGLAVVIKLSDGRSVFFRQVRVGQGGRLFRIVKFRSMVPNADRMGSSVTRDRDPRITPVGRFMRKTKLDELPQLWNVLVGEMSFVGPRPEVPKYVDQYTAEQRGVLRLKPGITDPASLEFRDEEELLARAERPGDAGSAVPSGAATKAEGQCYSPIVPKSHSPSAQVPWSHGPGPESAMETFYLTQCVPRKIQLSLEYAARATVWSDIGVIVRTVLNRPKSTDHRLPTTDHPEKTTDNGLQTTDHGLPGTEQKTKPGRSPQSVVGSR